DLCHILGMPIRVLLADAVSALTIRARCATVRGPCAPVACAPARTTRRGFSLSVPRGAWSQLLGAASVAPQVCESLHTSAPWALADTTTLDTRSPALCRTAVT